MNFISKRDMWEEPYAKIRTYGSVRGVVSNGYAYSISYIPHDVRFLKGKGDLVGDR